MNPPSPADSSRRARFRVIYDASYAALLGYALRRCPTAEDAADVVAETFLVAWRRLDDVPRGDEARPWLYGVARRVLANQRRAELRRGRLTVRLVPELPSLVPPDEAEGDADLEAVGRAFARLARRDREVLELVAWEGLAARDLAVVLGCTPTTGRVRLHRARKRFVQELSRAGLSLRRGPDGQAPPRVSRVDSLGREAL